MVVFWCVYRYLDSVFAVSLDLKKMITCLLFFYIAMVLIYYSKAHLNHKCNEPHPENPSRVENIIHALTPYFQNERAELLTFRDTVSNVPRSSWMLSDGDTYVTESTSDVLLVTKEMILAAVGKMADGTNRCGFVLCRPPGHHAAASPSGYCHENNAWTATTECVRLGFRNIAIFDMDAHHGDGTEALVRSATEPAYAGVRFVSTHAHGKGIYPGTGAACVEPRILNLPLPKGTAAGGYLRTFRADVLPFIGNPDVLIVSAGYDTHEKDPMKLMNLQTETYNLIGHMLKGIGCRVLFLLEGGYNVEVLGECVVETLLPWLKH
jgi:acetoin utilization deacetylase AcuC-like enzyme